MTRRNITIVAVFAALFLVGCADRGRGGDSTQSFLGISQDISSVFSTSNSYMSPLQPSYMGN